MTIRLKLSGDTWHARPTIQQMEWNGEQLWHWKGSERFWYADVEESEVDAIATMMAVECPALTVERE